VTSLWTRFTPWSALALAAVIVTAGCSGLKDQPAFLEHRRPKNVPPDAALVDIAKGGMWQHCVFDEPNAINRCAIYNWKGGVIYDEQFLPYDGGRPLLQTELRIPRNPPSAEPDAVYLENGRILIPKSAF
jgi:hypothetical protein